MGKTSIRVALAALLAASPILTVATSVAAATPSNGGYSVRPAEIDEKDPATRAYFKPLLKPGTSAVHHIVVTNLGGASLHLLVNAVDGVTGQTSGAVYANRQDPIAKAGAWLAPSSSSLTIAPHGTATLAFTIHVPTDAIAGDHLGGIAFENTATNNSTGSFAVKQVIREVVGVLVKVPGPASEQLTIGSLALQSLPGTAFASVIVNLTNSGQLLCKPELTVALQGPNGRSRTVTRPLDTVLPGDTIAYPMPWPDSLAAGRYTARATTSACGPVYSTADVPLTLGAPLDGSNPSNVPARVVRTPSLSLLLTIGLVIVGLLLGLLLGKRRRKEEEEPAAVPIPTLVRFEAPPVSTDIRRVRTLEQPAARLERTKSIEPPLSPKPEQQSFWP